MFDFLFGWRKASKCKKLIKRVQCRIKLLKNKNGSIARQLREDLGHLVKIGHQDIALNRAEQLYRDESIMAVYELLDHFCEFIIIHLSYIRRHKDCPNDINEAVSTLIYASARCGDLPELRAIRKLFSERYGQRFALAAVDLLPGNLVNHQVKEKLTLKSVPDDKKHRLLFEIFREHCLHSATLALEYSSPLALEYSSEWHQNQVQNQERFKDIKEDLKFKEMEIQAVYFDSSSKSMTDECFSLMGVNEITSTSSRSFTAMGASMEVIEYNTEKIDSLPSSVEEDSSWIPERNIIFLDIEEYQSPCKKLENLQDQRLFRFNHIEQHDSPMNNKKNRKRYRKRSLSGETFSSINDVHYDIYYTKNFPARHRKPKKMILRKKGEKPCNAKKKAKSCCEWEKECSLDFPCYFCTTDDKDESEIQMSKENIRTADLIRNDSGGNLRKKTGDYEKRLVSPYLRSVTMPEKLVKEIENETIVRCSSLPEPVKQQVNQINHVHPKLPDYDDLAAKFIALKQEYLQNKHPKD